MLYSRPPWPPSVALKVMVPLAVAQSVGSVLLTLLITGVVGWPTVTAPPSVTQVPPTKRTLMA